MKILIIGFGSIAKKHIANLKIISPDVKISVLCRTGKKRDVSGLERLFFYVDDAIAWGPNYIIIASPATYHANDVFSFAALNIPMLVEKPLTSELSEAISLLDKCDLSLHVGYQLRFSDAFKVVREWLNKIGKLHFARLEVGQYLPHWRPDTPVDEMVSSQKHLGGGVLLELSHEIDLTIALVGMPTKVVAVKSGRSHLNLDVEDNVELVLSYVDDSQVSIHLDMLQYKPCRTNKWIGEFGQLEWDIINNKVSLYGKNGRLEQDFLGSDTSDNRLQRQLEALMDGNYEYAMAADGLKVLYVIDAAKRSISCDKGVYLDARE